MNIELIESNNNNQNYRVEANEQKIFLILLGGKHNTQKSIKVNLAGEGGEAMILGIVVGRNKQSFTLNTLQKHTAGNTMSNLLIKGVFFDESKFRFRGLIEIAKGAQNANAFQQQNNLVLSDKVDVDTRPELEIEANEVRCTHAATVGRIDEEQLYYIMSRGLSRKQAEQLIVRGFLREIVEMVEDKDVRKEVSERIVKLLNG